MAAGPRRSTNWRDVDCYPDAIALFRTLKQSDFWLENRRFVVDRGVFDPVQHLSGMAFADHLLDQNFSGRRVLEIGTGCGLLAYAAFSRGAQVVATDVDPRAAQCAAGNLIGTSIDVRVGDLFDPVRGEVFDTLIVNPPYEVGRARRPTLRSPDLLGRLSTEWSSVARELLLAFPTDSISVLRASGIDAPLISRIETRARELGVFVERRTSHDAGSSDNT